MCRTWRTFLSGFSLESRLKFMVTFLFFRIPEFFDKLKTFKNNWLNHLFTQKISCSTKDIGLILKIIENDEKPLMYTIRVMCTRLCVHVMIITMQNESFWMINFLYSFLDCPNLFCDSHMLKILKYDLPFRLLERIWRNSLWNIND